MFNTKKHFKKHLYHHVPEDAGDKLQLQVPQYNLPAELV